MRKGSDVKLDNWEKLYQKKLVSPAEAVQNIRSGNRVVLGHAVSEPAVLVKEMVNNKKLYRDVEIVHMVSFGKGEYTKPEMVPYFIHNGIFVGAGTREATNNGRADYTPCFFLEVPRLFQKGYLPVDVALIQLSPPDQNGYCSFGLSCDYTKPAAECAKLVIAEINDQMPRTMGDTFIHISDIDYLVEVSYTPIEIPITKIGEVEKAIGENCASLIEDGSTLQLGIGAIPDAVLSFLKDKKDLGIHTEMFSDTVVDLVEAGVVNNSKKTIHRGKMIATLLMGTKKLYNFVHNNPSVEMYPVYYVNNPLVIAKNYKMVSINACLQIDLMGQVSSESIGLKQYSGVGGQMDYLRGVSMANGGKSIMVMPSTAVSGKISRIVPFLDQGTAITSTRNDVNYVVTEYGIAQLKGKTLKQRGKALIEIAHPKFRDVLMEEWEKRFFCKY